MPGHRLVGVSAHCGRVLASESGTVVAGDAPARLRGIARKQNSADHVDDRDAGDGGHRGDDAVPVSRFRPQGRAQQAEIHDIAANAGPDKPGGAALHDAEPAADLAQAECAQQVVVFFVNADGACELTGGITSALAASSTDSAVNLAPGSALAPFLWLLARERVDLGTPAAPARVL